MSLKIVQDAKKTLEDLGENLTGPCGALRITNLVAWQLRSSGAGLLYKPAGNNCLERAVDILAYADGRIRDILGDGGGANTPQWPEGDLEIVDGARWRAPMDPNLPDPTPTPIPVPDPLPAPIPVPGDLAPILAEIDALKVANAVLKATLEVLRVRIETIELKPAPKLEIKGSTSRVWGHGHEVKLDVTVKG